ncbi:diacylglycerol kinase [Tabrizicola sp. DMG-N-6]|uniref:Diacylglycerol kinase n=2 Tax=Szabonella alba TaxID=2804194 RepID=A0A8K0VBR0_9RHOB|nr:diacylglycerol kinase [Szabonella alba]
MQGRDTSQRKIIPPRGGLLHIVDAAGYSLAGLRRLWQETATKLEILGMALAAVAFLLRGADVWHWLVAAGLFALVLAVEALNTALEVLTDRISPEWSAMARDAKDLGSLAVGLMLMVTGGFVLAVTAGMV